MKEYSYVKYVPVERKEPHICKFLEKIVFGHPGKILECVCGKTKAVSIFNREEDRDFVLADNT